ncbi:methionine adenosyltransferase [Olegusella massiliensis]|uniref:methionine adenosyltransferase n=1 Tax=Olegusella massiliensis TaxID=1776381 RepID=UPI000837CB3B|nr:methionine adenosyltransferase [Olegusella massiliensis]
MSRSSYLFTSESVTEGHPDKIADQISDAVLDALITKESKLESQGYISPTGVPARVANIRCAVETLLTTGTVIIAGEVRTASYVDVQQIARETIRRIGYDHAEYGFDCDTCGVMNLIHGQSSDIAQGVDGSFARLEEDEISRIGAGDQGMMFGYATDETDVLMPMPAHLANRMAEQLARVRKDGILPYLRPDGKTQVTIRYEDGIPKEVTTVVVSAQHAENVSLEQIRKDIYDYVIVPVLESSGLSWDNLKTYINPTGRFVIGGPTGDTGLTGRKVIVDSYGGMGRHGGGAFSGKDCTKVDRSAAYAARWVAKNVVAAHLAHRCEVELAYAIGIPKPVSITVNTFGTGAVSDQQIVAAIKTVFDLRPGAIIRDLKLHRPIYEKTAAYGHFGREDPDFTWEQTDRVDALRDALHTTSA